MYEERKGSCWSSYYGPEPGSVQNQSHSSHLRPTPPNHLCLPSPASATPTNFHLPYSRVELGSNQAGFPPRHRAHENSFAWPTNQQCHHCCSSMCYAPGRGRESRQHLTVREGWRGNRQRLWATGAGKGMLGGRGSVQKSCRGKSWGGGGTGGKGTTWPSQSQLSLL